MHYYHVDNLDDVRVIRDRQTSMPYPTSTSWNSELMVCAEKSRQFGFLRFSNLQEAEDFMDRHYPTLYLYGDDSNTNGKASKVRIAFSRERKDQNRVEDADWICAFVWNPLVEPQLS